MKRLTFALVLALVVAMLASGVALADPPPPPEGVVNINAATADELERLPGVGPARAQAIVQLRERARRFGHAEDLLRVRGIGRVSFRRMRPYVTLAGETTLAARPGRAPTGAGTPPGP